MNWNLNQVRRMFIEYFVREGYKHLMSAPMAVEGDPSLLFVSAGMVPFKNYYIEGKAPYDSIITSQKCLRVGGKHNDLQEIGLTKCHHTFFEMLGNFVFKGADKRRIITSVWDFVTNCLKIDRTRLSVTTHPMDHEAQGIWGDFTDKITCLEENVWAMGDTGPTGYCTEIFFDELEIWNIVFMSRVIGADGSERQMESVCIDAGSGLERLTAAVNGITDTHAILAPNARTVGDKIVADHARAIAFLLAEGILPSATDKGYVLRKLIRRAMRFKRDLIGEVRGVIDSMCEMYPELRTVNLDELRCEQERFVQVLDNGMRRIEQEGELTAEFAFLMYDTYGFPVEILQDLAIERGQNVDLKEFERLLEVQRDRSKSGSKFESSYDGLSETVMWSLMECDQEVRYVERANKIKLSEYQSVWKECFLTEEQLLSAIGRCVHVGSTAVEGMAAKPIIDVLLVVEDLDIAKRQLNEAKDYVFKCELNPGHLFFDRFNAKYGLEIHLHVMDKETAKRSSVIRFKEYLQQNECAKEEYSRLKREIVDNCDGSYKCVITNVTKYNKLKSGFIQKILGNIDSQSQDKQESLYFLLFGDVAQLHKLYRKFTGKSVMYNAKIDDSEVRYVVLSRYLREIGVCKVEIMHKQKQAVVSFLSTEDMDSDIGVQSAVLLDLVRKWLKDYRVFVNEYSDRYYAIPSRVIVHDLHDDNRGKIVLESTPFYAQSGGQVADHGFIVRVCESADSVGGSEDAGGSGDVGSVGESGDAGGSSKSGDAKVHDVINQMSCTWQVTNVCKQNQVVVHDAQMYINIMNNKIIANTEVMCYVDLERRANVRRYHTATHLLHAALREVLGKEVQQKGSLVDVDRLRFDFSYFGVITDEQLEEIEGLVNQWIDMNYRVTVNYMLLQDALDKGAMALFTYQQIVRVIEIADISIELCGGSHVDSLGKIGMFRIVKEGAIASGIRRVEAVCGREYILLLENDSQLLNEICAKISVEKENVLRKLDKLSKSRSSVVRYHPEKNVTIEIVRAELDKKELQKLFKSSKSNVILVISETESVLRLDEKARNVYGAATGILSKLGLIGGGSAEMVSTSDITKLGEFWSVE